jgi:hypothetical protein
VSIVARCPRSPARPAPTSRPADATRLTDLITTGRQLAAAGPASDRGAATLAKVANPDFEARLAAVEAHVEQVARHLAAARDRDLADLAVQVDANRSAINALSVQTAARIDQLEQRMDAGFAGMRGRFDQTAAGMQTIVALLTPCPSNGGSGSWSTRRV